MFLHWLFSSGRLAPDGIIEADDGPTSDIRRAKGMLDMASQTEEEMELIRNTVAQGDILVSVLDVLRRLPRRVLMVMKLNDLAR